MFRIVRGSWCGCFDGQSGGCCSCRGGSVGASVLLDIVDRSVFRFKFSLMVYQKTIDSSL